MSNVIVSIIVVAAGTKRHLKFCLDSIEKQTFRVFEIIVLDNSLNTQFNAEFSVSYPAVKFFAGKTNLFYCEALNKGIGLSKGDFILCLNDDVSLEPSFIEEVLKGFNFDERIGMVSGKILRSDAKTIDSAGLFLSPFRTAKEAGYGLSDKGQFDKKRYVFGVNGAVAFYRKSMLENIKLPSGYFDPDFRFFYEDLDIAWRAQNFGWKGFYNPYAIAYHVRGATARSSEGINRRFARHYLNDQLHLDLIKNRYLCMIKNESLPGFLLHLLFILSYEILLWGYTLLFRPRIIKNFLFGRIPFSSAFRKRSYIRKALKCRGAPLVPKTPLK